MKTLVSALALLIGSNVLAVAGDQTLKFKLVTFYIGEKDGESHMVGVSVSLDGRRVKRAHPPDIARIIFPTALSW